MLQSMVGPVHFEDFSGGQFERLVYAYHLWAGWTDLAWYGQTGSDQGRDIIGDEPFDDRGPRRTVIQCVNRDELTLAKAKHDMTGAADAPTGITEAFKFVCRGKVSANRRDAVEEAGKALGFKHVVIWTANEFEEQLRLRGEFLLRRYIEGEQFPDDGAGLRAFVSSFAELDDAEMLRAIGMVFERPAFWTPFHQECQLPAFQRAIEDTIGALNTGIWKDRDGVEIRRIPSLRDIRDVKVRAGLERIVRQLDLLRRRFKRGLDEGAIRHCDCGDPACPTFMLAGKVGDELDDLRAAILDEARRWIPGFSVRVG